MVVVTALTGYGIDQIRLYVESLNNTGFDGRKIALYYSPNKIVKDYLIDSGWEVYTYRSPKYHINFQRFRDVSTLLELLRVNQDSVCFTDMRDVFFKKSPSNVNTNFYIGVDSFDSIEKHEWNKKTIIDGFPELYTKVKKRYPLCAGIIIGSGVLLQEFFREVYEIGIKSNYRDLVNWCAVDQAAVNVLAHTSYSDQLQYPEKNDRIVLNMASLTNLNNTENYCIYHQYDRHKDFMERLVNRK